MANIVNSFLIYGNDNVQHVMPSEALGLFNNAHFYGAIIFACILLCIIIFANKSARELGYKSMRDLDKNGTEQHKQSVKNLYENKSK